MASFNPQDFGFDDPPPRPTTPPVRRGFLLVLFILCLAAVVVYGVPYVADRISYAWEAGRARADSEALAKLDKEEIVESRLVAFPDGDQRGFARGRERAVVSAPARRRRVCGLARGGKPDVTRAAGSRAGLGGDHRQGARLHRHEQPRRQGCRPDHGAARARATTCRLNWSVPTPSPTSRF